LKADINLITARISETELRAPFDGSIGLRYLSEGTYVTANTKIAKLVKLTPIKIDFSISEKYASDMRIGYPITFSIVGTESDKIYQASVYAFDPRIVESTRVIALRALYDNKNEELKPGRYCGITMELTKIENAISIPTEAIIAEMEGEKVYVYKGGKAKSVRVTIGLRTESKIQITDGLNFGDTLLTTGMMQLRQNLPVVLDTVILNK
jgi:membrane fusion protein, multidrug efflux system